jgi:flagellar hook assembly protein FlgD
MCIRDRSSNQWAQHQSQFFIPTFGVPGSDNLLGCGNHKLDQKFAIGRIPAVHVDEITGYLEKVKAYEKLQQNNGNEAQRFWQKRIIHIHGGRNALEQNQLGGILNRLKDIIENNSFAANVFTFGKQSNEPVQGSAPEMIYHLINTGLGMITFLGHSGSTTLDFDIDNLSIYTNNDKYPAFIALGCSVGNMYSPVKSFGERFNLTPDKGTILFFSTSGLGYPATLETYAKEIYSQIDNNQTQPSYGEIIRNVHINNAGTINKLLQETIEQHTLNGDPAIKPNYAQMPDYLFETSSLELTPESIIVQEDSFQVTINMLNIGSNRSDSIDIRAILIHPDLERDTFFLRKIIAKSFRTTLTFQIRIPEKKLSGNYTLLLHLDPDSKVEEGPLPEAKTNNEFRDINGNIGFNFFIGDVNASPLYPPDFAVVHEDNITFYGISNDIFNESKKYVLEWDTSSTFETAKRYYPMLESNNSVFQQSVQLPFLSDTASIFWRVNAIKEDSLNPSTWRNHSFTRIKTDTDKGFGMFHNGQFKKFNDQTLYLNDSGDWAHRAIDRQYLIRNSIFINSGYPSGFYDGQRINSFFPFVSVLEGIVVVVLSPETGLRWVNPPGGKYGSINNSSTESISFPFPTKTFAGRQNLLRFLSDTIPEGATVLLYSILRTQLSDYGASDWAQDSTVLGTSIFIELEKQGINQIRLLESGPSLPFISSFVKDRGMIDFAVAQNPTDTILSSLVIQESSTDGQYKWTINSMEQIDQFDWRVHAPEIAHLPKFSISLNNEQSTLYQSSDTSGSVDLSINNAHPIRLQVESHNAFRTAYQPNHWRLKGSMLPDLSWNTFNHSTFGIDSIIQGLDLDLSMSIKNFSTTESSNFKVHFILTNSLNEVYIDTLHLDKLNAFEVSPFFHKISSSHLSPGTNQLLLVINPDRAFSELRYDNNAIAKTLFVVADKTGPILDVFFDGVRIMDGDLVSAKPEISIKLQDLNEILRLNDSTIFELKLKSPGSNEFENIPLSHPEITFIPASDVGKNEAQLIYKPHLIQDGQYFLEIQGRDASGNLSSSQPFRIRFQVINESSISALTNYPNPFSTKTRFVYTLTGVEPPREYSIRIFSISGQLVRDINHYEIGPLAIGKHLTSYEWDGRDQYGNTLANGVYLYRLIIKDTSNEPTKHLNTTLDQFSKGGWSKLVILK